MGRAGLRAAAVVSVVCCAGLLGGAAASEATSATSAARQWVIVAGSSGHGEYKLHAVDALSPTDAWAVGHGADENEAEEQQEGTLTEHWDGTAWRYVPSANVGTTYNYLHGVAMIASNDVWAVGYRDGDNGTNNSRTVTIHWDGTRWSAVRSPNPGDDGSPYAENKLYGVDGVSRRDVWAVGYRYNGGFYSELILRWNGRAWRVAYSPPGGYRQLYAVTALSATNVWAVGASFTFDDGYQGLIEHWDGSRWTQVPAPRLSGGYYLRAVTALSANDIWATGHASSADSKAVILHWNGTGWTEMPAPRGDTFYDALYGVAALGPTDVWAVGSHAPADTLRYQARIDHWDGNGWASVEPPAMPPYETTLSGIAPDRAGGAWAVGYKYGPLGTPLNPHILRLVEN